MNRYITRGSKPGPHKRRLPKPDPTMFHKTLTDAIAKRQETSEQKILG